MSFHYFTRKEYKKLIATLKRDNSYTAQRDLQWITIMRYTGIRLCVMRQFTVEDAQSCIATGRFMARAETNKGGVRKDGTVRKKKRVDMLLTEKVKKALVVLIRQHHGDAAELVVTRRDGKGMSARSFQKNFNQWKQKAELSQCAEVTVHGLRHTYAMEWLKSSSAVLAGEFKEIKALRQLQKNMNHNSIDSTMIYLDALSKEDIEICEKAAAL